MRIILHFGMYKTGSTSIQKTFHQNRSSLTNICYPKFASAASEHNAILHSLFYKKAANAKVNPAKERLKKSALPKLKKVLALNSAKNCDVLLSAEILSSFSLYQLTSLYNLLENYSKEIIAVGYVRPPKAYIESAFQETLKGGKKKGFNLQRRFPKYQNTLAILDQVCGKENVHFWKFEPASFPNGCVVRDFCQKLNIEIAPESIVHANESLCLGAISLLYTYSKYRKALKFGVSSRKGMRSLINLLSQYQDGKKLRFASEIIAPILDSNRSHIDWIEARMGVSVAENITKDDQVAIHSEAQLLKVAPETLQWLSQQLGADYVKRVRPKMTPQQIAEWMHVLHLKLSHEDKSKEKHPNHRQAILAAIKQKNIKSRIQLAKESAPQLEGLPEQKSILLIRTVLKQLLKDIENTEVTY